MAKLFDLIKVDNPSNDPKFTHSLNVFLSRLLFCLFAEDTGIFTDKLFSNSIESHTSKDGSDLKEYLDTLYDVLNTENRQNLPDYLQAFPYVNGGLFAEKHPAPKFSSKSRAILIECGADLNWSEINPDIFGSMIQAVVDVDQRGNMGMHYTSVTNIMKVIEPLFLNELHEVFDKSKSNAKKLQELLTRIRSIKIFDPACGSGNFLIIAYKELRKLEMEIFNQLAVVNKQAELGITGVQLSQFYGIDVPPRLSSTTVWSPILNDKEIGREEALYRRTDHWLPA